VVILLADRAGLVLDRSMDLYLRLLLRAALWIRRAPSREYVYACIAVAILVAVIVGLEALGWWPDWATAERMPRSVIR